MCVCVCVCVCVYLKVKVEHHMYLQQTVTIEKEMEAIHNRCYAVLGKTHTALSGVRHHGRLLCFELRQTALKHLCTF